MADEAETPAGVKVGRRPSGVLVKTAGVARERVLRYGVSFIFSLKMYIFRLEMKLGRQAGMLFSWGKTGLERDSGFFFRGRLYGRTVDREFIRCL
jgi:hypothetical protein